MNTARRDNRNGIDGEHTSDGPLLSIIHTVSSLNVGGMEQVILRLAAAQKNTGHRVGVLAIRGGPLYHDLIAGGIQAEVLGSGRVNRGLHALRYFRAFRPDIVHAHNPSSLHYAVLAKLVSSARVIVTVHGETNARSGSALEWHLVSAVGVVSHAALRNVRFPCAPAKFSVVHNGIAPVTDDAVSRDAVRRELGISERFVGIIVARLSGLKGHATLLRSVDILRRDGVDLLLLIAGDGAHRAELEQQAGQLSLGEASVRFLGARSDVNELLRAADFFVLPSDTEGLPLSVLEAMAHGLPVVASNVGGIPELIEHDKEGLLVPPADPKALAAAIRTIAEDSALRRRLGEAGRRRASGEFSLATTVLSYDRLYRLAVAG